MQAKDVIDLLRRGMLEAKKEGTETISMDALIKYLDEVKKNFDQLEEYHRETHEAKLAEFQARNQENLVDRKAVMESIFSYGQMSIKSAMLLNGGAAIAILAFIGNLWSKAVPQESLQPLAGAMAMFPLGALAAVVAACVTYLCQYCYSRPWWTTAYILHWLSMLMVVASLGFFYVGVRKSYQAFSVQLSGSTKTVASPQSPAPDKETSASSTQKPGTK